jgi:hypothetical protein
VLELSPYLDDALKRFPDWLATHERVAEQITVPKAAVTANDLQEMVKEWIVRMTASNVETFTREMQSSVQSVYIVDCPKLHALPKQLLEYKLRWCDKWAYEVQNIIQYTAIIPTNELQSIQENSPIINWKEGMYF